MSRNTRVAMEDQLLAALTEHGPLTTGRLRQLTGPHYQNARVAHGRLTRTDPNEKGLPAKHRWETCPDCQCTEIRELEGGWADTTSPPHAETARKKRGRWPASNRRCPTTTAATCGYTSTPAPPKNE